MTEKRFQWYKDTVALNLKMPIMDNGKKLNIGEIFNELNKLNDENEQLKSICQDHKDHAMDFKADCGRLEKENEKLKGSLNFCKKNVKRLHDDKKELINENEQLKKELTWWKYKCGEDLDD